jgi:hypothetical protein
MSYDKHFANVTGHRFLACNREDKGVHANSCSGLIHHNQLWYVEICENEKMMEAKYAHHM